MKKLILIALLLVPTNSYAAAYISAATGLFTDTTGTWALCDASSTTGTSYLDSEANNTVIPQTTPTYSSNFLWAVTAPTVDGVAVKFASRTGSPSGTITIILRDVTGGADVDSVTINVSDIDSSGVGWHFFKFGSSHALAIANNYAIGASSSAANQANLYRNATTGNWSHMLRTTTTAALAAGDQWHVIGAFTGAGSLSSFTITMDNTATTSFGPTVSGGPPQGATIGKGGTLTLQNTASTNYYLKQKGVLNVFGGGTLNLGTSGSRLDSSSTCVIEADSAANVDSGLNVSLNGTANIYAATKTRSTLLTADVSAAGTVLQVGDTTGWAVGDLLGIATTTRTSSQCEQVTILTVDSGTQVTLSAGVANAHSGTSPTQAEVINLTSNIKIRGVSTSLQGYVAASGTVNASYAEFLQLGSATVGKRGIFCSSANFDMDNCALHDFIVTSSQGIVSGGAGSHNLTFSNNVLYNINAAQLVGTSALNETYTGNIFMLSPAAGSSGMIIYDGWQNTFSSNTVVGANSNAFVSTGASQLINGFSSNTFHGNGAIGLDITNAPISGTISSTNVWRNNGAGISLVNNNGAGSTATGFSEKGLIFDGGNAFGNNGSNITITSQQANLEFNSWNLNGDTTFSTGSGLVLASGAPQVFSNVRLNSCNFSTVSGIKTAHTNDIVVGSGAGNINCYVEMYLNNTKLGAATPISGVAANGNLAGGFITAEKYQQTAGNHQTWTATGIVSIDTTSGMFDVTPSERLTPIYTTKKLEGSRLRVAVKSGTAITVTVKVRKSVVGDGTAYNGNQPRLLIKRNDAIGVTADTVLATATNSANGAFETETGSSSTAVATFSDDGVAEFDIDCDGNAGWVNVDTWTAIGQNSMGLAYWFNGEAAPMAGSSGETSYTYSG